MISQDAPATNQPTLIVPSLQPLSRPHTNVELEFDSGINSSAAWTASDAAKQSSSASAEDPNILSDDEGDDEPDLDTAEGRPARALYAFEGRAEFRELVCVEAGDELEVLKEDVGDGWSLVKLAKCRNANGHEGEIGLLPQSYYTLPGVIIPSLHTRTKSRREASGSSITPRGSPTRTSSATPLIPQTTGEWFPSFRRSLLGGRSLNRFSSFVTSGAEDFVLHGSAEEEPIPSASHSRDDGSKRESILGGSGETEKHFVEMGPAWKSKLPPFHVLVHSPSKRSSGITGPYTVYTLTSVFDSPDTSHSHLRYDGTNSATEPTSITVQRRFSHFVVLHTALTRRLPGIALPPLPEKQYAGRFNDEFVEARRGDLERYINRVVRHPVARYAEVLTFFLSCESDVEWKKQLPHYLSLPPKGPSFYAQVYHQRSITRRQWQGCAGLRNIFGRVREARVDVQCRTPAFYSLLSLITAKPLASSSANPASPHTNGDNGDEDEGGAGKPKGHVNTDGAWCWRENCEAVQRTAETMMNVADLFDDHARQEQLATHEALKSVAHPATVYAPVIDTHRSTLSRYQESIRDGQEDEEMAARCETVLNTTMAEMDTYHTQKVEDFQTLAKEHLDGEIALYDRRSHTSADLTRLRNARATFDDPTYASLSRGPNPPSMYERELENPRLNPPPLTQPCPHVFDSAPIRPVSVAIQEGMGMLLGGGGAPGRSSVFGRLWSPSS
ncbi:uncharacterized protein B0H18DRAFT_984853 [Fomitopsis serialis]|uniref:uncharacterized protein n=1 Tax=Fomitopsis serialis TaxID=139415 RepID=UPI002007D2BF|nr:uncharacterized protein B0H18DRAFT_984853 [Neoantrodia serialis]KAH9932962.1 hypothetical protein B0H18DRAFT_984853 [Neoantrodia serialis]